MSEFVPLSGRVACRRDSVQEKNVGGIIVPEFAQDKPQSATVVAKAEFGKDEAEERALSEINVGDRVMLGKYAGSDVEGVIVLNVLDILGVIR